MSGSPIQLVGGLLWPPDPATQTAILLLLGLAAVAFATVHAPLAARLVRIAQLQRSLAACFDAESSNAVQRQELAAAFTESPLAYHWNEFARRWHNAIAADPIQDASLPELSRAPVRLADILAEHPILPPGVRRSLLAALPAIFVSAGLLGAFAGLVLALPGVGASLDPSSLGATERSAQVAALLHQLGMAMRIGLWGLLLSLAAGIGGRVIEGRAESLAETLDGWVQVAHGSISAGELATRTAHEHRSAIGRLHDEVAELGRQVAARPRPLIRSTPAAPGAPARTGDAESAARGVEVVGEVLSREISEKIGRALGEQLSALRESLSSALERLDQRPAEGGLGDAVERLFKSSESQSAASLSLTQTAQAVSRVADELRTGLDELAEGVARVRETGAALTLASQRLDGAQQGQSRASESLASSFASAESLAAEHRRRVEGGLEEFRSALANLVRGLESEVQRADVPPPPDTRALEDALGEKVSGLGERLDALVGALRSSVEAKLASLASELRTELRTELRSELHEAAQGLEGRLAAAASAVAPAPDTAPPRAAVAGPAAPELEDETARERGLEAEAGTGSETDADAETTLPEGRKPASEADTVPYLKVPSPEAISQARKRDTLAQASAPAGSASDSLSGLLRATHHSSPDDELPPLDPEATAALDLKDVPGPAREGAAKDAGDKRGGGDAPRRRGFFGRRK